MTIMMNLLMDQFVSPGADDASHPDGLGPRKICGRRRVVGCSLGDETREPWGLVVVNHRQPLIGHESINNQ